MFEVRGPAEIDIDPQSGRWRLTIWAWHDSSGEVPFRPMLFKIAEAVGADPGRDLQLPPYDVHEDFIEGVLQAGEQRFEVYFEHALSYLTLICDSEAALRDFAERVQPLMVRA